MHGNFLSGFRDDLRKRREGKKEAVTYPLVMIHF